MPTGQSSFSSTGGTTYYDLTAGILATDTGDRAAINGALFFQNKPDSSSGTGLIQAIVRVQDPGSDATPGFENGYNTSFRPLSYEENTSPQFTTSLLLSEVPKVTINGVQYYEFRLDINQLNSSSLISLDALKVYTSAVGDGLAQGTIGGAWFTANADPVYDMDGAGKAHLSRSLEDPQSYMSFANWKSADAMHAWKESPEFREKMGAIRQHAELTPTEWEQVTEV